MAFKRHRTSAFASRYTKPCYGATVISQNYGGAQALWGTGSLIVHLREAKTSLPVFVYNAPFS